MKKPIIIFFLILFSITAKSQISNIATSTHDILSAKHKDFIILDEVSSLVLARKPKKYYESSQNPLCYFTIFKDDFLNSGIRIFEIHSLQKIGKMDDMDWVLQDNKDENRVFFARNQYIQNIVSKQWTLHAEGDRVLIKSLKTSAFLCIDKDGGLFTTKERNEATKWKLIYTF